MPCIHEQSPGRHTFPYFNMLSGELVARKLGSRRIPDTQGEPMDESIEKEHLRACSGNQETGNPLAAWFLGPRAENAPIWEELLHRVFQDYIHWRRNYFPSDPVIVGRSRRRSESHEAWLDELTAWLEQALNELKLHFPFHSPRYIGHMLSEQTLPSLVGMFAGLLFNPNNVTDEAAPVTVALELEVGRMVSEMLGFNPRRSWSHITSGGTVAHFEALWVARTAQFVPLFVRNHCKKHSLAFLVKRADQVGCDVRSLSDRELVSLRPSEALFMLRKLVRFIHETTGRQTRDILDDINQAYKESEYNVSNVGLHRVLARISMNPVFFVSAAAHYSIRKAANILGYGEDAVRLVPVTSRFKIDMSALHEALAALKDNEYVSAVVPIVGTTEEGAVDPVHKVRFLRDTVEQNQGRSFWIHVDAAWGGYIRSLFCNAPIVRQRRGAKLDELCDAYVRALDMEADVRVETVIPNRSVKASRVRWADREVYAAFLAIGDADSVVIDPHKMGYVPYPAGMVAFRNGLVTELIRQRAQYISSDEGGVRAIDELPSIDAVGGYILEGSKPGAVALGCWLAHKVIPLTFDGHGRIIRTSLLSAKKLFKHLVNHRHLFTHFQSECFGTTEAAYPFTFVPLYEPDTNVLCFVVRPMGWRAGKLVATDVNLQRLNELNKAVYARTSIEAKERYHRSAAAQPFYVSRTELKNEQYSARSLARVLKMIGVPQKEYRAFGVFVLRSVVMNPWYEEAETASIDYLYGFVRYLHEVAARALEELQQKRGNTQQDS